METIFIQGEEKLMQLLLGYFVVNICGKFLIGKQLLNCSAEFAKIARPVIGVKAKEIDVGYTQRRVFLSDEVENILPACAKRWNVTVKITASVFP